ncbi:complex I NDUFA9 subunit family protein [Pseudothauera nasutitermitis]|uniref:Complex I NDUFA9 subunit family protein n=1 Tax=Pseudothauera nasutitermitis TaxID=2565930 RepID=A0A4S4B152_9RHOO|nr:complex I NDUFA9 subunit family protein [Pseudothauera nasutitermitis]THF64618.1 complex I NDUFA9 subunit family protein [Pseudothauera nasutitermitis]
MNPEQVVLVGGSGFLGAALANRLCATGVAVTVPTRRRARAGHLLLLPNVTVVEVDVRSPGVLEGLFTGADAVVNLVGVLHSRPGTPWGPGFEEAHVALPKRIVAACEKAGVGRLVHVSALGADAAGPSEYLRSKAAGEEAVRAAHLSWTILRPSVVFGRGDRFLNLFATLARRFPLLPLACADARFQPVWVEDVAEAAWRSLRESAAAGQACELAGPRVYTLRELVAYAAEVGGRPRRIVALPNALATLQAALMELAPEPLMSRDNLRSMRVDSVASGAPLPFGLTPTPLEAVAPGWLGDGGASRRYDDFRRGARRGGVR